MQGYASDFELGRMRAAASMIAESPGLVSDSPRLSGVQLLLRTKLLQAQRPDLGLIIIDGLWLMEHPHTRGSNRATDVGQTVHLIKAAAKETGVPVLLLHQLNRANEQRASKREVAAGSGGRPILSDLRETGDVEQDADLVIFIHRERRELGAPEGRDGGGEQGGREDRDDEPGPWARGPRPGSGSGPSPLVPTELIVAKNRNGPTGTVRVLFDLVSQRWLTAATERG
jgi:replicative DNA helicase